MERTYLVADSSLSPHLSSLLLILGLLSGLQQLLDAVLFEPSFKPYKPQIGPLVGLSLEVKLKATREMTLGRDVCQEVGNIRKLWCLFAQNA